MTLISCDGIDLDEIINDFSVICTNFLIKYLSLPLIVRNQWKFDFQPLVDKATSKVTGWYWKHHTHAVVFVLQSKSYYRSLPTC